MPSVTFTNAHFHGVDHQQDDPMVIIIELENFTVKKTTYQKLQLPVAAMVPYDEPIYDFFGEVLTRGYIDLHTVFREGSQTKTIPIYFLVVEASTSYNVLLGRPSLNTLGTVLPVLQTHSIERQPDSGIALSGEDLDPTVVCDSGIEPVEETRSLDLFIGRTIKLGASLQQAHYDVLTPTLTTNADLFAWSAVDLPDVDPQVAIHKLSIYKEAKYISQKKRKLGEERWLAAKVEAEKLLDARFIAKAHYSTWLSTVVLVKKANGK
ncbi:uncharacterized protein LOC114174472 [Vigna unguiculata]|uniref:uncharacterized protein LOC114174472 n=1 Tax=Vigna unguiculata TaxID=3917 RepID=UPI001016456A|nr:uncharacterized protein LOC114174472 [Vigna unguiculata]